MSYHAPPPPPPDGGFHPYMQPAPKKSNSLKIVAIVVGGVVLLCLGMGVIGALLPEQKPPTPAPAAAAPAVPVVPSIEVPSLEPASPPALSEPEKPKSVKMPDVKGQNAAIAEDHLRKLGFTNIQLGSQDELDTLVLLPSNWTVTKQSTKAGRTIPTDTLIVLTCTKER